MKVGGKSPSAGEGSVLTSMTRALLWGVAVGTKAKGSGVRVGVAVDVGVMEVGVGVGACCRKGRTSGGLVKIVRMDRLMTMMKNDFDDKRLLPRCSG